MSLTEGGPAVHEQGPVQHRRQQPGRLPGVADGGAPLGLVAAGGEDHRMTGVDPGGREAGDRAEALRDALGVAQPSRRPGQQDEGPAVRGPRRPAPVPAARLGLGLGQPGQRVRGGRGLAAQQRELGEGPVDVRGQRVEPLVQRSAGQFRPGGEQPFGRLPGLAELTAGHRGQPLRGVAEPERNLVAEPAGLRRLAVEQVEYGPGVAQHERRLGQPDEIFLNPVGGEQEPAAPGVGGLLQVTPGGGRVAGREQGLAQDDLRLGGIGVRRVAQPGPPVRQQRHGEPNAFGRRAGQPRHVRPGALGHSQPPPRRRVLRRAVHQGQPGPVHVGHDDPGLLAAPGLGGQRGQVRVGPGDPGLVLSQPLVGDSPGQLPRVRRRPPVPELGRGKTQMAGGIAEPLQVVRCGVGRRRAVQVGREALPERDRPLGLADTPPVQGAGFEQNPDHDGVGVRLGPRVGPPPGHRGQRRLGAFQVPRQRSGQPGQVALEPQRRQPAREQIDRTFPVGEAGAEGDVGQPGGALRDVRLGQVGNRLGAGPEHWAEEIGEDVAPAVPARGRDPAPRAVRPAGHGDPGAGGELAFLRRGDVADPVADLGHQRVLGAVEGDDHAQRRDSGGPGRRHRADRAGR